MMAFQASQTYTNYIKSLGGSYKRMSNTSSGGMYGVVVESLGLGLEFGAISICASMDSTLNILSESTEKSNFLTALHL